jgi:hypothetical protein
MRRVRFTPVPDVKQISAVALLTFVSTTLFEPLQIAPLLF